MDLHGIALGDQVECYVPGTTSAGSTRPICRARLRSGVRRYRSHRGRGRTGSYSSQARRRRELVAGWLTSIAKGHRRHCESSINNSTPPQPVLVLRLRTDLLAELALTTLNSPWGAKQSTRAWYCRKPRRGCHVRTGSQLRTDRRPSRLGTASYGSMLSIRAAGNVLAERVS